VIYYLFLTESGIMAVGYYPTVFLVYLNICLNPFIYATKHEGVKRQLARLMALCRKRNEAAMMSNEAKHSRPSWSQVSFSRPTETDILAAKPTEADIFWPRYRQKPTFWPRDRPRPIFCKAAVGTEFYPHTHTHGDPHTHGRPDILVSRPTEADILAFSRLTETDILASRPTEILASVTKSRPKL